MSESQRSAVPPGVPIRPDGSPAGSGGGGGTLLLLIVLGIAGVAVFQVTTHRLPDEADTTTVVAPERRQPEPAPIVEPAVVDPHEEPSIEPEPVPEPPRPQVVPEEPELTPPLIRWKPPPDDCLEELECLMLTDPPDCCRKYARSGDRHLGASDIKAGVAKVKRNIMACADQHLDAVGVVEVRATVSTEGRVTVVSVLDTPKDALGACVAKALKRARFPKSHEGAIFTIPFNFNF